ncbi:MAG TPA: Spy/CpxP family protein refolding chaperone [Rhodocyclaceae bacterium]|nr:Spy/CpxP family protein refolding chaperone [Rhodocyclaceae bacterium]
MNSKNTFIAGFLAVSAAFFGVAHAQPPLGCDFGGPQAMQGGGRFDPSARVEQRLTRLKTDLKLTPQQEPLWQAFADKSKAEAGKGMKTMRERMQNPTPMPAPERMAQMETLMKERAEAMATVHGAFKALYAELTSEQKAVADRHFSRQGRGGPGRGGPGRNAAAPAAN